jgi:hypothetical protein
VTVNQNECKRHLTDDDWKAIKEKHAKFTPEEARAWIRKVMGPDRRKIEGTEREHMLTVFRLLEPIESTNNQRLMYMNMQVKLIMFITLRVKLS